MGNPVVNSKGEVVIPRGYMWCDQCQALTPHEKVRYYEECVVCGTSILDCGCPNCGAPEPDNDTPFAREVVLHHPGCHCQDGCGYDEDIDEEGHIRPIWDHMYSWAEQLCRDFRRQWMAPFPDRGSYCLPRDREWFDGHQRLEQQYEAARKVKCGCPVVTIYPETHVFNYESHSVVSFDCMNAVEWSYQVRCPVCGEIYDIADGNC